MNNPINSILQQNLENYKESIQLFRSKGGNQYLLDLSQKFFEGQIITKINSLMEAPQTRLRDVRLLYLAEATKTYVLLLEKIIQKPLDSVFNNGNEEASIFLVDANTTTDQLAKFYKRLEIGHAYVNTGIEINSIVLQTLTRNFKALYYLLSETETSIAATQVLTNPTAQHITTLWRIIDESSIVKSHYKSSLEPIKFKKIIYLPKLFQPLTLISLREKTLQALPAQFMFNAAFRDIKKRQFQTDIRVRVLCNSKSVFRAQIKAEDLRRQVQKITNQQINLGASTDKIQILPAQASIFASCCTSSRDRTIEIANHKNILIHIHGGGFVSMTSFSHQAYMRRITNQMPNTLAFSIDYRLAPEHPFPQALDDCWQTYLWIIHFAKFYFQTELSNIILTGDSAGGNLALGIVIRAIETGQQVPDKIILQYPALNLNPEEYVPSMLLSLHDMMIPFKLLYLCSDCYLQGEVNHRDPYISPYYMDTNLMLKYAVNQIYRFPKDFVIFVGNQDVLRDYSVEFKHRFEKLGLSQPKLFIFQGLPHGFQNLRNFNVSAAAKANDIILQQFQEFAE